MSKIFKFKECAVAIIISSGKEQLIINSDDSIKGYTVKIVGIKSVNGIADELGTTS